MTDHDDVNAWSLWLTEELSVTADRLPTLWRSLLDEAGIDHHPAQLVWVSNHAVNNDTVIPVVSRPNQVEHREPPLPCATMVFEKPLVFGVWQPATGRSDHSQEDLRTPPAKNDGIVDRNPILIRSLEWSHRHDDTVLITGYAFVVDPLGQVSGHHAITVATRPDVGLLQFKDAMSITTGELITGEDAVPPLCRTSSIATRKAQKIIALLAQEVWRRWASPRSGYETGEVWLPDDDSVTGGRRNGSRERDVSVLVVGESGQQFPELGETVPWSVPRSAPDHRWHVRGHWRNQPCGPGGRYRRKIWVTEHVSGPPGKPVRDVPKVHVVR